MSETKESFYSLEPVFSQMSSLIKGFKRKEYPGLFASFREENHPYFEMLNEEMAGPEAEMFMTAHAKDVAAYANQLLNSAKSKIAKGNKQLDLNMFMAVYFLPAVLEDRHPKAESFTEFVCISWNETFQDSAIRAARYETIVGGFRTKLCYVTTAVCESMNKPKDCYELTLLKRYRDEYLLKTASGEELVHRYYNVAPTIVKRINASLDADKKYEAIWKEYLKPCIMFIENGDNEECSKIYMEMMERLVEEYVHTNTN